MSAATGHIDEINKRRRFYTPNLDLVQSHDHRVYSLQLYILRFMKHLRHRNQKDHVCIHSFSNLLGLDGAEIDCKAREGSTQISASRVIRLRPEWCANRLRSLGLDLNFFYEGVIFRDVSTARNIPLV